MWSTPPDAGAPTHVWLVAVLTALTVELTRAAGPSLDRVFAAGVGPAALTALGTYAGAGLVAAMLLALARDRAGGPTARTVLVGTAVLAVVRLAAQGLEGDLRLAAVLVGAATAVATLTLAVAHVAGSHAAGQEHQLSGARHAATGLVLGAGLAVGVQLPLGSWDAVWRHGPLGWGVALALAGLALAAAAGLVRWEKAGHDGADHAAPEGPVTTTVGRPRRLWALGLFVSLCSTALANPAFVAAQSGVALGEVGLVLVLASTLGVWGMLRPPWSSAARVVDASVLLVGATASWLVTGPAALVAAALALAAAGPVLAGALSTHRTAPAGVVRTCLATAATGLAVIVPVLVYMVDYDVPLGVDNALAPIAATALLAGSGLHRRTPGARRPTSEAGRPAADPVRARVSSVRFLVLPALVLAAVGLGPSTTSSTGPAVPARAAQDQLTLVSWNLHYGVSPSGSVDLEQLAATIEAQDPDVVALQEVSRGWVLGGGADMATWLARRLDMTVRFAPAADQQFGNAVLARSELTDVEVHALPYGAGPQQRSALATTVTTADGSTVRVTSVHLQHREQNTPTRLDQLGVLLAAEPVGAGTDGPSVLAGDLNATPGSPELELLAQAGWTSAVDEAGDPEALTSPSIDPVERIDWVLGRSVTFEDAQVLTSPRTSDHLPLVVRLHAGDWRSSEPGVQRAVQSSVQRSVQRSAQRPDQSSARWCSMRATSATVPDIDGYTVEASASWSVVIRCVTASVSG